MTFAIQSTRIPCAECARVLRLAQKRAASTSTSSFASRGGSRNDDGGSWQPRDRRAGGSLHRNQDSQAFPLRRDGRSALLQGQQRSPGRPQGATGHGSGANSNTRIFSKPEANKTKYKERDIDRERASETVNVNLQGSALAALLSKGSKTTPKPPTGLADVPSQNKRQSPLQTSRTGPKPQLSTGRKPRPSRHDSTPRKTVEIATATSVNNLARILGMKLRRLQHLMERMGMPDTRPDRLLNAEDASLVSIELGYETAVVDEEKLFDVYPSPPPDKQTELPLRPPIITIMGHVDHGKTSLLDALRSTKVAAGEAGGITQHIGAFSVPLSSLLSSSSASTPSLSSTGSLTFLDTPGHAAFTAMRSRGASVTDVVVLVVAADDGVKPQTEEVINLIKNEDVGIVVAITKCDKAGIDISRVHNELLTCGLEVEALGGDIPCVEVSAHTCDGLPELVETINAIAEVRDLRAEVAGVTSEGRIIESRVERGRGNVATVIVTRGTLEVGATIVAGTAFAKVRQLASGDGKELESAGPGTPIEVTGWKDLPEAGDEVLEAKNEEDAKKAVESRKRRLEKAKTMGDMEAINEKRRIEAEAVALVKEMQEEAKKAGADRAGIALAGEMSRTTEPRVLELNLIVKSDFNGTLEAVSNSLAEIGNNEAKVKIVYTGVGDVTDGDLAMAKAVNGIVVGFNIKAHRQTVATAEALHVPIMLNNVIYRLIDDIKARVIDLLPKLYDQRVLGEATIQQIFNYTVKGAGQKTIAGCRVGNGNITKKAKIRVIRNKETIFSGNVESLKHLKSDVEEVKKGTECGLAIEGFKDYKEGDTIQSYEEVLRSRNL